MEQAKRRKDRLAAKTRSFYPGSEGVQCVCLGVLIAQPTRNIEVA